MSIDLDAIERRATAATAGPWATSSEWSVRAPDDELVASCCSQRNHERDGAFIAHARVDVATLIAAVRERDAMIAWLREGLNDVECELRGTDVDIQDALAMTRKTLEGPT